MKNKVESKIKKCSFCGATEDECRALLSGPDIYICDECINLCQEILENELSGYDDCESEEEMIIPYPKEIKAYLDKYVVGQEIAKKQLAVAVYNHYKRIQNNDNSEFDKKIQKSNIFLLGPTGSGKTYLAKTLAEFLDVPFAIADATTLTEAGYVGEDVENVLLKLIQNADYDINKAERGIIYIDEIDKIAMRTQNKSITRDVSGEGVQQALLKIIEDTIASVPPQGGRKNPTGEMIKIDTSNILFICGGAFDGIDEIIENRLNKDKKSIGFDVYSLDETNKMDEKTDEEKIDIYKGVEPEDIEKYGFIPEFVGRLPIIATLTKLDKDALKDILIKPENSIIKQYQRLLKMDNIKLEFNDAALDMIAKEAIKRKTGARSLKGIIEKIMLDLMYDLPGSNKKSVKITDTIVKNKIS